jgi:hypothetical protein
MGPTRLAWRWCINSPLYGLDWATHGSTIGSKPCRCYGVFTPFRMTEHFCRHTAYIGWNESDLRKILYHHKKEKFGSGENSQLCISEGSGAFLGYCKPLLGGFLRWAQDKILRPPGSPRQPIYGPMLRGFFSLAPRSGERAGERLRRRTSRIDPQNPCAPFHLPLLHTLVEERGGVRFPFQFMFMRSGS